MPTAPTGAIHVANRLNSGAYNCGMKRASSILSAVCNLPVAHTFNPLLRRKVMPNITVQILDATENKQHEVTTADNVPLSRIIPRILEHLKLPANGPDGRPLSYKLHHKPSGKQLRNSQTLADAGVNEGDALRLLPEYTAG